MTMSDQPTTPESETPQTPAKEQAADPLDAACCSSFDDWWNQNIAGKSIVEPDAYTRTLMRLAWTSAILEAGHCCYVPGQFFQLTAEGEEIIDRIRKLNPLRG